MKLLVRSLYDTKTSKPADKVDANLVYNSGKASPSISISTHTAVIHNGFVIVEARRDQYNAFVLQ